jgi:DNA-binding response OmpR family regulator
MAENGSSIRSAIVVEDDDQIAYLLRFILEKEGYAVTVAADGRAAQALIDSASPPAIVTLDTMLPHVNGLDLLALIRSKESWAGVPVLMLTAKSQEKDVALALEAGATAYLVKPFKPEALRARVRELTGTSLP